MRLSRRQALAGLGGLAAQRLAGGKVRAQDATPAADEWSFTDDAGKTVTLPQAPRTVVADLNAATALWDFGVRPVAVSGWTIATDAAWGNIDRDTPVINATAGAPEPDLEQLLEIRPDLFVTITWGPEDESGEPPYAWSFTEDEHYQRVNDIVPVIGISAAGLAAQNMARYAELAALLGADLDTPELQAAKATYDERVARFSEVAQEKAGAILQQHPVPRDLLPLRCVEAGGKNAVLSSFQKFEGGGVRPLLPLLNDKLLHAINERCSPGYRQRLKEAGVEAPMAPKLGDGSKEPSLADVPVLAFVPDVAQKPDLREELLQEADGLIVGKVLGAVLADKWVLGKERDLGEAIGFVEVAVVGQPHAFIRIGRAYVARPDHPASVAFRNFLRDVLVEELLADLHDA